MDKFNQENTKNKGAAASTTTPKSLSSKCNFNDTSATNQRHIVLMALRECPKTTITLRHDYGVMMPAARIKELRLMGFDIATIRITSYTPDGIKHSAVAKYVLRGFNDE